MSAERYIFDTNIYFYSLDSSAGDKHLFALQILLSAHPLRSAVLLQTLGELANSILKRKPTLFPSVAKLIDNLSSLAIPAQSEDIRAALAARQQHGLQFWDAMLWATAKRIGCTLILTEDLQDGRTLEGVTFHNPFKMSDTELKTLIS